MTCRTEDLTCLGQQQGSEILGELKFETIFASRMTFAWILEVKMIIWGVSGGYSRKIRIIQMPVLKGFSEIQHRFPNRRSEVRVLSGVVLQVFVNQGLFVWLDRPSCSKYPVFRSS